MVYADGICGQNVVIKQSWAQQWGNINNEPNIKRSLMPNFEAPTPLPSF